MQLSRRRGYIKLDTEGAFLHMNFLDLVILRSRFCRQEKNIIQVGDPRGTRLRCDPFTFSNKPLNI